jgi:hypothetical protein
MKHKIFKKLVFVFAVIGMTTFFAPKVANASDPCPTLTINCCGTSHYAVVCNGDDIQAWVKLLCTCNNS